jgi:hypothetical protein
MRCVLLGVAWAVATSAVTGCGNAGERAWAAAVEDGSTAAFQSYLERFPQAIYADSARERLAVLLAADAWAAAVAEGSLSGMESYLERFPESAYADSARARLYPLADQGLEGFRAIDDQLLRCGEGGPRTPAGAYIAEEEVRVTPSDLKALFGWNGVERLFRVPGDDTMAGVRIDGRGRPVVFGNQCYGNVQWRGPVTSGSGEFIFGKGSLIIHP